MEMNEQEFVLWDERVPHKKYPRFVRMGDSGSSDHFPPDSVLERGAVAVSDYWNRKNLRKRVEN